MPKSASYIPNTVKVVETKSLCPDTKALTLEFIDKKFGKNFDFLPGQFVILSVPGFGESVIAITSSKNKLPLIEVAVRSVGNTTMAIHRLKVGDRIGLRGPYGNNFPLDKMAGKQVLVVAGGLGLAPLKSLIEYVADDRLSVGKLTIFAGARTPNDHIFKKELHDWQKFADVLLSVNTGDGQWKGHVGFVTELFAQTEIQKDAVAIVCGPPVMFVPVKENLAKFGIKEDQIFVSLERRMKCGIGKCQHCTCGDKYVCIDGPIFALSELKDNWEAFV